MPDWLYIIIRVSVTILIATLVYRRGSLDRLLPYKLKRFKDKEDNNG